MPHFRKKPVEIEAIQFTGDNAQAIANWMGGDYVQRASGLHIQTLEGVMHVSEGDWVIRGVKGEFWGVLLARRGDVTVFTPLSQPAPTPTPDPDATLRPIAQA